MPSRKQLESLLLDLFNAEELRLFVRSLPNGDDLERALPSGYPSPALLCSELVGCVMRDRRVDTQFFVALIRARPRRAVEIHAFTRDWRDTPADPPPASVAPGPDLEQVQLALNEARTALRDIGLSGGDARSVKARIGELKRQMRPGRHLRAGNMLDDRYGLHRRLGQGSFGEVWLAWDDLAQEAVALKILHAQWTGDRSMCERFFHGARVMSEIRHEGVVRVLRARVDTPGAPLFVLEWMKGGDLHAAVSEGRIEPAQALNAVRAAGQGLAAAHLHGLVHRDVKPANVLLDGAGRACLTDFDLVRALDTSRGTRTGAAFGTVRYAAPEALEDASRADVRADVYGLALTLAFALSRREPPVKGLVSTYIARLPLSASVRAVLEQATADDADDRHASVLELMEALQRALPTVKGPTAAFALEAALFDGPEKLPWQRRFARALEGRPAQEMQAWRQVLDLSPGDLEALRQLAALEGGRSQIEALAAALRTGLRTAEGQERGALLAELARALLHGLGEQEEAMPVLAEAILLGSADAMRFIEDLPGPTGPWQEVLDALVAGVVGAAPDAVPALCRAARVADEKLRDGDQAAVIYAQVLERDPRNATALRFLAARRVEAKDLDGAVALWRRLLEPGFGNENVDHRMMYTSLLLHHAEAELKLGRDDVAMRYLAYALDIIPGHLPSLRALGPLYEARERWALAREVYRQILLVTVGRPDSEDIAWVLKRLGTAELRLGNDNDAEMSFKRVLERRPNDIGALKGMAQVLVSKKEWLNVLNIWNNIIYHGTEPAEVIDAYLAKGFTLDAKMNLMDKAGQHYAKCLDYDPAQPEALLRLAELSLRRRLWTQADVDADKGLNGTAGGSPHWSPLLMVKACALAAQGHGPAAAAIFDAALAADASWGVSARPVPSVDVLAHLVRTRLQSAR